MNVQEVLYYFFTSAIFIYSIALMTFSVFIAAFSLAEIRDYMHRCKFTDYNVLAVSDHAPSLSLIAPAYNEGSTIIENVRSLLSIHYPNFEVIIVNDGSKDDSLQKLILAYDLVRAPDPLEEQLSTKPIRGLYKSRNAVYRKLTVVDKVNGGKADALNVGINVSTNSYIVCIDVDCILEQDAMLKLTRPFLDNDGARVIATGGVVRIANSCEVQDGKIVKVNLPKEFLPRMQTLEYMRAFLLGRMAWSRLNGLLLISGAFGAFDREIVILAGGYNHNTVGEDMELVVRMRRYMEENNKPYRIAYIPDPLCWTEAPATFKILGRQRNRWTRGTVETLNMHKVMFFNRKYGVLGMLSYPYWFFYEMLAPLIEFTGFIGFLIFAALGMMNWSFFIALFIFIYGFALLYSVFAILVEVITYNQYKKRREIFQLVLIAAIEPFIFHPFVVWSAVRGFVDIIRKKKSWGEMSRQGFGTPKPVA